MVNLSLLPLRARVIAINLWGEKKKRSHEPMYKTYTKIKEVKNDNFCYRKVGGAKEKRPILLSQ